MNQTAKDPMRQFRGLQSRQKGALFEQRIEQSFEYYRLRGFAAVSKTPEPMKVIKRLENNQFIACFEKKSEPDYKGTKKGGRTLMFEAKYTSSDRILQSRVSPEQGKYLDEHEALGARCFVICGFDSGEVYLVPWADWKNLKALFGHKYATEQDLRKYKVATSWHGTLLLI